MATTTLLPDDRRSLTLRLGVLQYLVALVFSALAALLAFVLTLVIIKKQEFFANDNPPVEASVKNIGTQMLSITDHGYILPFEVVSILLLAAMIGCIVIAIKTRTKNG